MTVRSPGAMPDAERTIGQLMMGLTYVAVGLLVVGVVLMAGGGIDPLSAAPAFDVTTLGADLAALDPGAFLWVGLVVVIAAPVARVVAAAWAYGRQSDWRMLAVSIGILGVVVIGISIALRAEVSG